MLIKLYVDSTSVLNTLSDLGEARQGRFILSRGLNLLAKRVQAELQKNVDENLHLRRRPWILKQVKIGQGNWSTMKRLVVKIQLSDAAKFISDFEMGAERVPHNGHSYMAFPNKDVFGNGIIGQKNPLRIKNLNLHDTPQGVRGDQDTFIIHSSKGTPLIMQRLADAVWKNAGNLKKLKKMEKENKKGRNAETGLRILYNLIKNINVPKKISWYDTANSTVVNEQYGIFSQVIKEALADPKKSN